MKGNDLDCTRTTQVQYEQLSRMLKNYEKNYWDIK